MPPTLVNVAVGVLLGVALLGAAFDRRSLAVVALAAALPDLDALLSLALSGATNAALHNAFVPLLFVGLLYWDAEYRENSWLRDRYGPRGVRVAWVALASFAVAGIGLDLFNIESVAILYPLSDRYYAIVGQFLVSSKEGVIQSYVQASPGVLPFRSVGTADVYHVASWVNPGLGPEPAGVERRAGIVDAGWQLVIVVTAVAAIPARWRLGGEG